MKIFIGSSKEAIEQMENIAIWIEELGHKAVPWNKPEVFPLGEYTLDSLIEISNKVDGAVFVFSPDDVIWYRKDKFKTARDNVIFEYGLFSGSISKNNVIFCKVGETKNISDLGGITYVDLSSESLAKRKIKEWVNRIHQNGNRKFVSHAIKPIFEADEAREKTHEIYSLALKEGGNIRATHIFSKVEEAITYDADGKEKIIDIALDAINQNNCNKRLKFERILLFKNQDTEKKWIEDSFKILKKHSKIVPCFYIPAQYPINPNDWFSGFSTKTDLLLFSNTKVFSSLFGFDHLQSSTDDTFTAFSQSSKVYNRLVEYFEELTDNNLYFRAIKSIDDYSNARTLTHLPDGFHQIIEFITNYSKLKSNKICYLGIFGSVAKLALKHLTKDQLNENDADIDFLVVANDADSKDFIKNELYASLTKIGCFVTFGPDPENKDVYPKRQTDKINVDIEILLRDDSFYQINKLLGYSISRYLYRLNSWENREAGFFIRFPNLPLNTHSSYKELLQSRKGLLDFKKIIERSNEYDPNRIVSLIFRNLAWADSGHYPESTKIAIDYLQKYNLSLGSFDYKDYEDFSFQPDFKVVENILKDAISLASFKLEEPNKCLGSK